MPCWRCISAVAGRGPRRAKSQFVPIAEVAPELVTIAQKQLPDVKFESARKIKVRGQDVFEIRGKQPNGKIREVEVAPTATCSRSNSPRRV